MGTEQDPRATGAKAGAAGAALGAAVVRELDRAAIEEHGVPSLLLMENAGRACAFEVERLLGMRPAPAVWVLCGPGNNGGDGFVIARTLRNRGVPAHVVFLGSAGRLAELGGDPGLNLALWRDLGEEVAYVESVAEVAQLVGRVEPEHLLVDALFGTGLDRPLRSPALELVRGLDSVGARVVAVDLPSGLQADTGEILGAVLRASLTVTFVAPKPGFERGDGPDCCGEVRVKEIGIPHTLIAAAYGVEVRPGSSDPSGAGAGGAGDPGAASGSSAK